MSTSTTSARELVLEVKEHVDPEKLDLSKYDEFLDMLCKGRDFQKEAIKTAVIFLLSEQYNNTEDLAEENFEDNNKSGFREYYSSFDRLRNRLEFPDKLACTIDLATGTGKSWVMYGIAQILLCEGMVDQVLVLGPSLTVKKELIKKFKALSVDPNLRETLQDHRIKLKVNPRIKVATYTIKSGDICIDNVHKTYSHISSSINDSLVGKGERTLVLNDECHHIMNPTESEGQQTTMKEWKKFLVDPKYNFKFIVGFSGTPYRKNDYASDVIYRYSIMDAMDSKLSDTLIIKKIDYLQESTVTKWEHKLEEIYQNHMKNKKEWSETKKHITIFVTQTIAKAATVNTDIIKYLIKKEKLDPDDAEDKVLIVSSHKDHSKNLPELAKVGKVYSKIEWIVSVSMLTEGWDVENVFQIVPHQERAFDSKLLIAQVLGRGLRVPEEYRRISKQPTVVVYNHNKWGEALRGLVEDVMEYEKKVRSYIVDKKEDTPLGYNFELMNLNYKKKEQIQKSTQLEINKMNLGRYELPKLPKLSTQRKIIKKTSIYVSIKDRKTRTESVEIPIKFYSIDRVISDIQNKLLEIDEKRSTLYVKKLDTKKLKQDIEKALKSESVDPEKTGEISEDNKNRIEMSYNVLMRGTVKSATRIIKAVEKPFSVNTRNLPITTAKISEFQKNKSMIIESSSIKLSKPHDINLITEASDEAKKKNVIEINNKYLFKCPLNLVIISHNNEKDFARKLIDEEYSQSFIAWIKSTDRGFYDIPYTYREGTHQKQAKFNPDFFIKVDQDILVVEIKSNIGDMNHQQKHVNKQKLKWSTIHFQDLNKKLNKKSQYYIKFLGPEDFIEFFDSIKKKTYTKYISGLEADLNSLAEY